MKKIPASRPPFVAIALLSLVGLCLIAGGALILQSVWPYDIGTTSGYVTHAGEQPSSSQFRMRRARPMPLVFHLDGEEDNYVLPLLMFPKPSASELSEVYVEIAYFDKPYYRTYKDPLASIRNHDEDEDGKITKTYYRIAGLKVGDREYFSVDTLRGVYSFYGGIIIVLGLLVPVMAWREQVRERSMPASREAAHSPSEFLEIARMGREEYDKKLNSPDKLDVYYEGFTQDGYEPDSVESPDGRHKVFLFPVGEIRMGPIYYNLQIDQNPIPARRPFGQECVWSADGKYVAVQEWMSTDEALGPSTSATIIRVVDMHYHNCPRVAGFAKDFSFRGGLFYYTERRYSGEGEIYISEEKQIAIADIDMWIEIG